ncbi:MAG: hydroxylamine reductase, partial [Clostridia bacterium]|nr:hydroxylamine reductase [Clostridia bacterium]
MFCYQCQETLKGEGCTLSGVCGKSSDVAGLQDLLIYTLKGISVYGLKAKEADIEIKNADDFIIKSLFATITNVNFDADYFVEKIKEGLEIRDVLKKQLADAGVEINEELHDAAVWKGETLEELEEKVEDAGILATDDEDIRSLRETIIYGLKGLAAYMEHADVLGYRNDELFAFMHKALAATLDDSLSVDDLVALTLETGKHGVDAMALLDKANTETYGNPEITNVNIGVGENPGILISGHDLRDMEELLEQTKGTGVDVYTHGEMLPAHYYPAFKKYDHFAGNYGNAWWKQSTEFESFNGPILMTTNCLVPPKGAYKDRVYTTGVVGFPDLKHVPDRENGKAKDFSEIIEHAKKCDPPKEIETGEIVGGFAHNTVLGLADKVIEAVKAGHIKKFFVMAGCDGRM